MAAPIAARHVAADLVAWWPILRAGGIMFGDDYQLLWVDVVRAVHDFADRHGLQVEQPFENKWLVHHCQPPPQVPCTSTKSVI